MVAPAIAPRREVQEKNVVRRHCRPCSRRRVSRAALPLHFSQCLLGAPTDGCEAGQFAVAWVLGKLGGWLAGVHLRASRVGGWAGRRMRGWVSELVHVLGERAGPS